MQTIDPPKPGQFVFSNRYTNSFTSSSITVLTWNLWHGFHDPNEFPKTLSYIQSMNPDVLLLQEIDWGNERTKKRNLAGEIAKALQMNMAYAPEFLEHYSWRRKLDKKIGQGGGVIGNAILSRFPLQNIKTIDLYIKPKPIIIPSRILKFKFVDPHSGSRNALLATISVNGKEITLVSTHLEIRKADMDMRILQFKKIGDAVKDNSCVIIGGDFNTAAHGVFGLYNFAENLDAFIKKSIFTPEAVFWEKQIFPKYDLIDPFDKRKDYTIHVGKIWHAKLDWLLSKNLSVLSYKVGEKHASDHKPLIVELSL